MDINKLKIIKLDKKHIDNVQIIWRKSLPDNLKSMIGNIIVNNYLSEFFNEKRNLGIGVTESNNLVGFVLFGKDEEILRKIIKNDFTIIIRSFLKSIFLFKIKKIKNFIDCFIYMILSKRKEKVLNSKNLELLIICIDQNKQNKGLGSFLLKESFKNYYHYFRDFDGIFVKTLKKDSNNVLFYQKNNFKHLFEIFGRVYLKY